MNTKEKILLSAAEEFSTYGYHETTIKNICLHANVNIAAVNYHFNCKKKLYKYVVEYLYAKVEHKNIIVSKIITKEEWRHGINNWVKNLLCKVTDKSSNNKWINRIFFREMLEPSEFFPEFFAKYFNPYIAPIENLVRLGLPTNTDKKTVYSIIFSTIAQCLFYEQSKALVSQVFSENYLENEEQLEKIVLHITNTVCLSLEFRATNQ